jgi:NitT/TauT family transport system permease protein
LGAYLQAAANQGDFRAIAWGVGTLVLVILALDQLVWRPLLAWSERFKVEMVESDTVTSAWFYDLIRSTAILHFTQEKIAQPLQEKLDTWLLRRFPGGQAADGVSTGRSWLAYAFGGAVALGLLYAISQAGRLLVQVPAGSWVAIGLGLAATLGRVSAALAIALAWTIPVGVAIGTSRRLAALLQPIVQVTASVPATALFPVFLLFVLQLPQGLNLAAILLMLLGTQWYLLFNIIAGASAIPQDLKYTTTLLHLGGWGRWRTLILPALFPYLITGAITASGGAWNASIVAEQVTFAGKTLRTIGIGAQISQATATGNYPLLLAATLSLMLAVILINRLFWRRLYQLAEDRYRME